MIDVGIVTGSEEMAKPLIIGKTLVYVHEDIQEIINTDEDGEETTMYQYHEYQYTLEEYITSVIEKQRSDIDYIAAMADIDLDV